MTDENGRDALTDLGCVEQEGWLVLRNLSRSWSDSFTVDGLIAILDGTLEFANLTNLSANVLSGGTYFIADPAGSDITSSIVIHGAHILTNEAHIQLFYSDSTIRDEFGADALRDLAWNGENGVLELYDGRVFNASGDFHNSGTLRIGGPSQKTALILSETSSYVQNEGVTKLLVGELEAGSGIYIKGGKLTGTGTLIGDVQLGGGIAPDVEQFGPVGELTIEGSLHMLATAITSLEIQDPLAEESGWDVARVTGHASLDGELRLSLLTGVLERLDGTEFFVLLTASSLSGSFSNADGEGRILTDDGQASFLLTIGGGEVAISNFRRVPEPSVLLLGMGGFFALRLFPRRRRAEVLLRIGKEHFSQGRCGKFWRWKSCAFCSCSSADMTKLASDRDRKISLRSGHSYWIW